VGDMALFMVKNDLQPEDVLARGEDLAFPESVVGLMKGMLGQPHGGFPKRLQEVVLKGQEPIHCRPGELLEPADMDGERRKAEERVGGPVDAKGLVSWLLYPNVYPEFRRHLDDYSDTSVIPTPAFLYGLDPGQETSVEIEPGKILIIKLNAVGGLQSDGTRSVYFELNGEARAVTVRDRAATTSRAVRQKADRANPRHVGAPMPGQVLKVNVKAGDAVRGGEVMLVTEAMKMETNVKLKADAVVAEILVKDGDKIEKDDLVAVLA